MPWWSWVLIWVLLVLAMLGMLALFGWWLFRKAMTAFEALGELTSKLELLDAASDEVSPRHFTNAILRDRAEVQEAHRVLADLRADRKRVRRESRLARGKLLVTADLRKRTFPWESSATHSDGRT
ncbi:hypothetical protein [Naasia aerilata]|uniref:DUF2746 domain-containing protein n=1 Tax=Naasia aerilata TaxID=1162966 RepID=A0ABN6XUF8_9MICO|nr:hypothetical protein [Naasia aerilata]BDZ47281.1 hypothetical protein GCM10025866_31900 [Naasia aerilata]